MRSINVISDKIFYTLLTVKITSSTQLTSSSLTPKLTFHWRTLGSQIIVNGLLCIIISYYIKN